MFSKILTTVFVLLSIAGFAWNTSPANAGAVEDGLISYWPFNKGDIEGDKVKDILGGQHATMNGAPKVVAGPGHTGNALEFDGDDWLLVTDDINAANLPTREMTAEVWVYTEHFIEWGGFLGAFQDNGGFEKGWVLGTYNQFSLAVSTEGADDGDGILTYLKTPVFEVNEWYHLVGTYDGSTMKIYVNGNLEGTSEVQSGDINYPDNIFLSIGIYKDDNENFPHTGMLDEVRLYERALTEAEVLQNYAAQGLSVDTAGKLSLTWGEIKHQL